MRRVRLPVQLRRFSWLGVWIGGRIGRICRIWRICGTAGEVMADLGGGAKDGIVIAKTGRVERMRDGCFVKEFEEQEVGTAG